MGGTIVCQTCPFATEARSGTSALGLGAQHHDATGHEVHVQVSRMVAYGGPPQPGSGQQDLLS